MLPIRLPTQTETEKFLASNEPQKYEQVIDELLSSKDYADYFAGKWSALLRNRRKTPADAPQPKEEPKPAAAFTTAPRLVRSFDANLTGYPTPMWNATGTHLALFGSEVTGKQEFPEPGKSPVITTVSAIGNNTV